MFFFPLLVIETERYRLKFADAKRSFCNNTSASRVSICYVLLMCARDYISRAPMV